ncbi:MAG: hypothetical protein ACUVWO_01945 [Thermodesulfobacteriota bacterium]
MEQGQIYAAGLEQILRMGHLSLKESVAHFEEICHMVTPERSLPHDVIVDIRKAYREIQDQLKKIRGIQQLLEGKYRHYYRRNPRRDKEITECGFLAKNTYIRFEYILRAMEEKKRLKQQERRPREYGLTEFIPWFRSVENQRLLLRNLSGLSVSGGKDPDALQPQERRQAPHHSPQRFSLFILSGEVDSMDDLEGRIRLRECDIAERYGPDEFRGALTHFKEMSPSEEENIIRRQIQSGKFSKPKGLLFPIQSSKDLGKEVFGFTKRLLHSMVAGEVKTVSI